LFLPEPKPTFGGFNYTTGTLDSNKLSTGLSFGSKPAENGSKVFPAKRGREEGMNKLDTF